MAARNILATIRGGQKKPFLYSTLGLLQYVGPTLQFLIGVLVFGEPFPRARAVGFVLIWMGLVFYAADSLWRSRR